MFLKSSMSSSSSNKTNNRKHVTLTQELMHLCIIGNAFFNKSSESQKQRLSDTFLNSNAHVVFFLP